MQPLTASIHYEDPNYNLTIVVRQATAMDGMRRSALIGQVIGLTKTQRESEDAQELMDGLSRYWLGLAWAACRATTVEVTAAEGDAPFTRDISFEDFQQLPRRPGSPCGATSGMRLNPALAPAGGRTMTRGS